MKTRNMKLDNLQSVAESLKRARKDGLYESVVPYVLACNADQLNPLTLVGLAYLHNQVSVLGYFAEAANQFRPHANLQAVVRLLKLGKSGDRENLWVRGNLADHLNRWKKWEQSQKNN